MRALATNDDFTVLARPSIFTANNMKGVISSGEQIAIPTNSNTYYQGGGNTQIQYVPVELRLEVIPLINSNDELTLQISLLSDEVSGSQTVAGAGPNGGDLTVPRVTTRELVTTVTVPNNETIVLGGLITTRTGEGVSGIPLLSDIPILGKLFSYTEAQNERAELLVFIQPSIISSRGSLEANQRDSDLRYRMSGDARSFADGANAVAVPEPAPVADKAGRTPAAPPLAEPAKAPTSRPRSSIRPIQVR
ncbi:MAG: type II and III secretion system protein [Akkermansiaceae bacterium]|nr:type II and III secretion system protein [Akkermansiaceae bacterium]